MSKSITNLSISKKILNYITGKNKEDDSAIHFELVNDNLRHIYDVSKDESRVEGITKYCHTSNGDNECFVSLSHKSSPSSKLLLVCEGNGSVKYHDKIVDSSNYVSKKISKWFKRINKNALDEFNTTELDKSLHPVIKEIHKELKHNKASSKMILVLCNDDYTYMYNLGDLRCYVTSGYDVIQMNEEDSDIWRMYRSVKTLDKEELRFTSLKRKDVSMLGKGDNVPSGSCYFFKSDYSRLYLFSRGVVDAVDEDRLTYYNSSFPTEDILKRIIEDASSGEIENYVLHGFDSSVYESVKHGSRDCTALAYTKKKVLK